MQSRMNIFYIFCWYKATAIVLRYQAKEKANGVSLYRRVQQN